MGQIYLLMFQFPVISMSVVFDDGPVSAVDNLVFGCSIADVFDSVEEGFSRCIWIR